MQAGRTWVPVLIFGWLCLAGPTLWDFLFGAWSGYSQGHELLLLSVAGWLMWQWEANASRRLPACPREPAALEPTDQL